MTIRTALVASAATLSLAATPVVAAELPVTSQRSDIAPVTAYDADGENAENHRYRGYRGYRGYRHRNRVDAGDVIAGVAILGGIAAIASAASKNRNRDRYRDRRYPSSAPNYNRSSGLDRAVDQCVREVERNVRIGDINGVDRTASGWLVTGSLYNGQGFSCQIGSNGRIEGIEYGASAGGFQPSATTGTDRQWDDSTYDRARTVAGYSQPDVPGAQPTYGQTTQGQPTYGQATYGQSGGEPSYQPAADSPAVDVNGPQPAYPGGPVPGQPQYGDEDGFGG